MTDKQLQTLLENAGCYPTLATSDGIILRWEASSDQIFAVMHAAIAADRAQCALPVPHKEQFLSKEDLATLWNQQADDWNQWKSLSLDEQLEWAQSQAIAADRAQCGRHVSQPVAAEREALRLGRELETMAESHDQGTPEERALEAAAAMLRRQQSQPVSEPPAEALAARPLLEEVAKLGDVIDQATVRRIIKLSKSAEAWLRRNPPGQPIAIEPRGCPAPGMCGCVVPAPTAETSAALLCPSPWSPMTSPDLRAVLHELIDAAANHVSPIRGHKDAWEAALDRACAALYQPAPPVANVTPSLDALLSPRGAYEPGTGKEDGAQLVGPQWWAPVFGRDTLENLLDQIHDRIIHHLRPPVEGIDVIGPDGDGADLQDLCDAEGVDVKSGARLLMRARKAWDAMKKQPQPVAEEYSATKPDWRSLCKELLNGLIEQENPSYPWPNYTKNAMDRASAWLDVPQKEEVK